MEIFLLVVIIGFLIYIKTSSDSKHHDIDGQLRDLRKTIDGLKATKPLDPVSQKAAEQAQAAPSATMPQAAPAPVPATPPAPSAPPVTERINKPAFESVDPVTKEPVYSFSAPAPKPVPVNPQEKAAVFTAPAAKPAAQRPYEKSFWEKFKEKNPDLEKFIGENLINKIGVLILVLGISYFVKYAIDRDWINEPARVGIGILAGGIVMAVAHRLRKNFAAFSSVLVAGAVAIFYFTIGIAFHDYHLFGQSVAFGIMVVITAFSAFISLSYNRMELAILTLIGGFAVPFMVSTGEGNYVVLFSYILLLDLGILIIAYFKRWQLLNILAFAFTAMLYAGWLYGDVTLKAPHFAGGLAFAIAFYFAFTVINLINTVRRKAVFNGAELSLMVTNTFLFYAAGSIILASWHPEFRGLFTASLALLNLAYAIILYRKFGVDKIAVYLLIGLTLTFITLAVPVQFAGNNITLFWSAEMVLLMWLGQRSGLVPYRFASIALLALSLASLVMDWAQAYLGYSADVLPLFINAVFITGLFSSVCLAGTWFVLRKDADSTFEWKGYRFNPAILSKIILVAAIATAYCTGLWETSYQSSSRLEWQDTASAVTALYHLLFTTVLCFFFFRKKRWALLSIVSAANIVLFAFWFSTYAFSEIEDNLVTGKAYHIAFYCHYAALLLVACCGYFLYFASKEEGSIFKRSRFLLWAGSFFVIYILSSETILHGIMFNLSGIVPNATAAQNAGYSLHGFISMKIHELGWQISKTALPVLWGLLAFSFLILGIRRKSKQLRIIALTLLGLTIAKLFLYDIRNASETGKIIAFILLGVLILVISFVYQKIRLLVIEGPKNEEDETTA